MRGLAADPLIGRTAELAAITAAFAGGARLVTLWGPGGIGKTRLARHYAEGQQALGHTTTWIDLSASGDLDAQLAAALALPSRARPSPESVADDLAATLAEAGPILVVLDPVEAFAEPLAARLSAWLPAAPEATFLLTGERRVELPVELVVEVGPLPIEPDGVDLLVAKVRSLRGRFELDASARALAVALVARLDGHPLAIELASARVESFGLGRLLERLSAPGSVLAQGRAGQRTLRDTIGWSWSLLGPDERRTLAAAALVYDLTPARVASLCLEVPDVAATLAALADRALISRVDGAPRYRMLDAIRAFAVAELPSLGIQAEVHLRWTQMLAGVAEEALAGLAGAGQEAALAAIAGEERGLLSLLAGSEPGASAPPTERRAVVLAALALEALAVRRGPIAPLWARLAALDPGDVEPELALRLELARARCQALLGQPEAAIARLDRAVLGASPEAAIGVELVLERGVVHHQLRALDRARADYEAALARAERATPSPLVHLGRLTGRALGNLGALAHDLGDYPAAAGRYAAALARLRETGERRLEGIFETNLAVLHLERGALAEAHAHLARAEARLDAEGDRRLLGITLGNRGTAHLLAGDLEAARRAQVTALELVRSAGDRRSEMFALGRLGFVEALLGVDADARVQLDAAEGLARELGDATGLAVVDLFRGGLELGRALAAAPGSAPRAEAERAVSARLLRLEPVLAGLASDEARFGVRVLTAGLAGSFAPRPRPPAGPPEHALWVGPDAEWFRPPGGTWQDFRRRQAPRRLLLGLIRHRREAPGRALSAEALQAIGWPGERIAEEAALNRVRVALAMLRKLGLKDCLRSRPDGYVLDPALEVVDVEPPAAGEGADG